MLAAALLIGFGPGAPAHAQAPAGVPVTVVSPVREGMPILARAIGTVQAFQSVLVRARLDGTPDKILFTEGQQARPGDLLAQLDPRPYRAALDQAIAKRAADAALLANARGDLDRYADLAQSQAASRQKLDPQRANVAQAEANVQRGPKGLYVFVVKPDNTAALQPVEVGQDDGHARRLPLPRLFAALAVAVPAPGHAHAGRQAWGRQDRRYGRLT